MGISETSQPQKIYGSEKLVDTYYNAEIQKKPSEKDPEVRVKCKKEKKYVYKTTVVQTEKYHVKGVTFKGAMGALGLAILLGAGSYGIMLLIDPDDMPGIAPLSGVAGFGFGMWAGIDMSNKDFYKYKEINAPGPIQQSIDVEILANKELNLEYDRQTLSLKTNNSGILGFNIYKFHYPVLTNHRDFNFSLKYSGTALKNSPQLNSKLWMKQYKYRYNQTGANIYYYSSPHQLVTCDQSQLSAYDHLFDPKSEFETYTDYQSRVAEGKQFQADIIDNCIEQQERNRIFAIINSYESVDLSIENIETYNLNRESFYITINGKREEIIIPLAEAKSFKENLDMVAVKGEKQLLDDGITYDFFNIHIIHPVTGSIYTFGKQKAPLYVASAGDLDASETGIPNLTASAMFIEPSGNRLLDAREKGEIAVTIVNRGNSTARNISVKLTGQDDRDITFEKSKTIIGIAPEQKQSIKFEITASKDILAKDLIFLIEFVENKGFQPAPLELVVSTQQFLEPKLAFIEAGIKEVAGNDNNIIENNEIIEVTALIQNRGRGIAKETRALINIDDPNIIQIGGSLYQELGDINPGESKTVNFSFAINNQYSGADKLPISIKLSETEGEYGGSWPMELEMKMVSMAAKTIIIEGQYTPEVDIPDVSLHSDVDRNIPVNRQKDLHKYALIIGNEDYSSYQAGLGSEVDVDYALNDALVFKKYLVKTLGFEEKQIKLLTNATKAQITQGVQWLNQLSSLEDGNAELVFYYSGHGIPDEETHEAYILPVDVSGSNLSDGIQLNWIYEQLSATPAQRITVFLDACFSGGARNEPLYAMKSVRIKPKKFVLEGNIIVFASSTGEESSAVYRSKQHGLFTYYLLKKLQLTGGNLSYGELYDYIEANVSKEAVLLNNSKQTPEVLTSSEVYDVWHGWKVIKNY